MCRPSPGWAATGEVGWWAGSGSGAREEAGSLGRSTLRGNSLGTTLVSTQYSV